MVADSISQRTRVLEMRMALGEQCGSIRRMVLREAGWMAMNGIAIGVFCTLALGKLFGFAYGVLFVCLLEEVKG